MNIKCFYKIIILSSLFVGCTHTDRDLDYADSPTGVVNALWQIIDSRYCFVEEKGCNWDSVLVATNVSVKSLRSADKIGLFDECTRMLDCLHDGHVNLYTPFETYLNRAWYDTFPDNFDWDVLKTQYLPDHYKTLGAVRYARLKDHEDIGYIYYSSFQTGLSNENIYYILSYFRDCKGLILDVRNNGGGSLDYAERLAAVFVTQDVLVGYRQHKTGVAHDAFSPMESVVLHTNRSTNKWLRPVCVLGNRQSYSATNYFLNACRYIPSVTYIGGISGGGGGIPMSYELPNGWMIRFSSVRLTDRDKRTIEEGIMPDIVVTCTPDHDEIIESAIENIYERGKQ